jgi:hypothetical protein
VVAAGGGAANPDVPAAGDVGCAGFAAVSVKPRHSATKTFFVLPPACIAALFAFHSASHCFAVFC